MGIVRPHLWFDDQAASAARFYADVIPNTVIHSVTTAPPGTPGVAEGSEFIVELTIDGMRVTFLNAGPVFTLDEAFSFVLDCAGPGRGRPLLGDPDRRRRPAEPVRLARRQVRRLLAGGPRPARRRDVAPRRRRGRARHGGDADDGQARHRGARGGVPRRSDGPVGGIGLDGPVLTIASVNVNGIRAAYKRGMGTWLEARKPDVILLQEVRATRRDPGGPPAGRRVAPRARGERDQGAGGCRDRAAGCR